MSNYLTEKEQNSLISFLKRRDISIRKLKPYIASIFWFLDKKRVSRQIVIEYLKKLKIILNADFDSLHKLFSESDSYYLSTKECKAFRDSLSAKDIKLRWLSKSVGRSYNSIASLMYMGSFRRRDIFKVLDFLKKNIDESFQDLQIKGFND